MNEPDVHADGDNTVTPLPGEPGIPDVAGRPASRWSRKGLVAVVLLVVAIVGVAAVSIHRFTASGASDDPPESRRAGDRPAVATSEPKRPEMPAPAASANRMAGPRIPALVATEEELAEPIGVRRTGQGETSGSGKKAIRPEDAPVLLVTTRPSGNARSESGEQAGSNGVDTQPNAAPGGADPMTATARNLQGYQRQLQGLLEQLTQSTALATGQGTGQRPAGALLGRAPSVGMPPAGVSPAGGDLFGGQLQGSATPKVAASTLGNRSLTLPKGTAFTCALKTKVISATSGLVGCQVQRNVFSDEGRVLLIERGSHMDGEYRIASVRPGTVRIPVLWTRIRTPLGVTVDIDSPGTGQLGESGIDGYVDNRWGERIGAAMLLSIIDDAVSLVIQNHTQQSSGDTIVLPSTTANSSKLAEKVLESTINIPPQIYQNQGGIVGIYVARDVDFSSVYELKAVAR
jgi:type IV secretion system protein VirB10